MIEILITLVILSIGLLGIAGLQLTGLQSNRSAYYRSQATVIASDMIDRMRTNVDGVTANAYDNADTSKLPSDPNCISTSNGCSAASLANNDIREWGSDITSLLPSGRGTITANAGIYTVTVNWVESNDTDNSNKSVAINIRP
jgi:type IV pilus assembly protein PilV